MTSPNENRKGLSAPAPVRGDGDRQGSKPVSHTPEMSRAQPRKGEQGTYQSLSGAVVPFVVHRVEGKLCYATYGEDDIPRPFIWRHSDGLNKLHDWPSKARGEPA